MITPLVGSARSRIVWGAGLGALAMLVYVLRLDAVAGLIVDDAWYVVLAMALAQGDGYRLISSGTAQILPAVPPGFPLLLSGVFTVSPDFPANVIELKAVSIAAMIGVGVLTYRHLSDTRLWTPSQAAPASLAVVLTPAFVFLATSTVMAECVFTLAQLGALWLIDRATRVEQTGAQRRPAMLAGLAAGGALLVRSAGIAVVLAGVLLLLWRRRYASAALFGLAATAVYAPWFVYAQVYAPTPAERMAHGGAMAYSYSDLLRLREGGVAESGRATPADVAGRVAGNVASMFGKDIGAIVAPVLYRGAAESGQEVVSIGASRLLMAGSMGNAPGTYAVSLGFSAVALVGFVVSAWRRVTAAELLAPISVVMIALVPSWSFRYTLTLTPFILYYLLSGSEVCLRGLRRVASDRRADTVAAAGVRIAVFTILGLHVVDHVQYAALSREPSSIDWLADAQETDALLAWMRANVPEDSLVASTNPGLVFLHTGLRAIASDNPSLNWPDWRAKGVRHMVALRTVELPPRALGYELRYTSPRRKLWVVEMSSSGTPLADSNVP